MSLTFPLIERQPAGESTVLQLPQADELVELSREECLGLLAGQRFGRVVLALGAGRPMIWPVNYVFDERSQSVAFRTNAGAKFYALLRSGTATFEVDGADPAGRMGWSVIVTGVTEEVSNPCDLRRLQDYALDTWAPGNRPHWVRIRAWTVSGRRIVRACRTALSGELTGAPTAAVIAIQSPSAS